MTSLKGLVKFWMANARYDFLIKIVIKAYPSGSSWLLLLKVHPVGDFYCPQIWLAQRRSHIWARSLDRSYAPQDRRPFHSDAGSPGRCPWSELRVRAPLISFRDHHRSILSKQPAES